MQRVPYDLAHYARARDGDGFVWPIQVSAVKQLNRALHVGLRNLAIGIGDAEQQTTFTVAAPPILVTMLTLGTAHLTVSAARRRNLALTAGEDTIASTLARGGAPGGAVFYDRVRQRVDEVARPSRGYLARRIAHRWVTNRGPGLVGPQVSVLNHNGLLQSIARADRGNRFRYVTPDRLLKGAGDTAQGPADDDRDLATKVSRLFADVVTALDEPPPAGLADKVTRATAAWLSTVSSHRRAVAANWRRPPRRLWTGTGGNHVSRLAAARVRETGGQVTVHEHGGGGHIHRDLGPMHLHEFSLCDAFVADTEAKAAVYKQALVPELSWTDAPPAVAGRFDGGQGFHWLPGTRSRDVRRVMYVTTAFVAETQYPLQPLMADVVYADWQGRLLDGLAGKGFEMVCKQHPEGLLRGEPLKLSDHAHYIGGRFGECIDQADAFVFDYPATTALWEAVCTEKPVLFIDLGLADWNPEVYEKFRRRCAIVDARFNERNLPEIDFSAAAAALRDAPMDDAFATAYLTGRPR